MNYKTYAEAKIANPDSDIFTNDKDFKAVKDAPTSHFPNGWAICNPVDYCMTLEDFIGNGFKLVVGDKIITIGGDILEIKDKNTGYNDNCKDDHKRYILSAAAINGGCKIPKAEQWTVYNNTLPLCELTDEQAAMLFNAWRSGGIVEYVHCESTCLKTGVTTYEWSFPQILNWGGYIIYRIKPKSERDLFIEAAISHGIKPETQSPKQIFGELFGSGKFKYIDNTQHFGENI